MPRLAGKGAFTTGTGNWSRRITGSAPTASRSRVASWRRSCGRTSRSSASRTIRSSAPRRTGCYGGTARRAKTRRGRYDSARRSRSPPRRLLPTTFECVGLLDCLVVDIAQVGALIPGVSRSRSTLTASRTLQPWGQPRGGSIAPEFPPAVRSRPRPLPICRRASSCRQRRHPWPRRQLSVPPRVRS
jgi:hypothetical protein